MCDLFVYCTYTIRHTSSTLLRTASLTAIIRVYNGKNLLWEHISRCYFADLDLGLHQLPKLTIEHIHLFTSYAKMRVNLAVQILSKSMAEALRRSMPLDESQKQLISAS
jgi:hypothetical protein